MTDTSRDWLSSKRTNLLAWWIPLAIMLAGLFFPVSLRTGAWLIALGWMGAACMLNARRCNRTHCRYTGPYFLLMIVPVMALGTTFSQLRHGRMVLFGRGHSRRSRSHMVGHRAGMGKVLVAHDNFLEWLHLHFRILRSPMGSISDLGVRSCDDRFTR